MSLPLSTEKAPENFFVQFETSEGKFKVEVHRSWSPAGADRFYHLVKDHFFNDTRIFRVVPDWVAQFGVSGDPRITKIWKDQGIADEPVVATNERGTIAYAMDETPESRATQVFINYADNSSLDDRGFAPFGKVVEGMDVVDKFNSEYGEKFRDQTEIEEKGNAFLDKQCPNLSKIFKAVIVDFKS